MRSLGIDYGAKRVGLALSDETGLFAQPYQVLENGPKLVEMIKEICAREKVGQVVLGESFNGQRQSNLIMSEIARFKSKLAATVKLPIIFEPEWFTSAGAERIVGKDQELDARAAALILQSYLDKPKNVTTT